MSHRREFLKFLAASPLLAGVPALPRLLAQGGPSEAAAFEITRAAEVLSVEEFQELAEKAIPPAHWGYLMSGTDGDLTLRANREGFTRFQLRARRLVDISSVDMSVDLFGTTYPSPIGLCPIGSSGAFHPEGEVETARAAQATDTLQILSTQASRSIEDVVEARQAPIWHQLYTTNNWEVTEQFLKRAEDAGCPVVAITVDTGGRNTETARRFRRLDTRNCEVCHDNHGPKPMFEGVERAGLVDNSMTWDIVDRVRDVTTMRVVLKGLEAREDAELAVEHGADGIIVSNHGARAGESGRGTIEALPEVIEGAAGRIPVMIDGGFRRGQDVYKALAMGASAVFVGRPHIWGLATFGQDGVERVLNLMRGELRRTMQMCGTTTIRDINPAAIIDTGRRA